MRIRKRTDHGYIDGQTAPETPIPDRHIAGPTTGSISFTENSQLLQFRREETCVSELEYQVSQAIVPRNSVAGLLAAQGVIPKYIHGLLAKRARGRGREHRLTEETGNSSAVDPGGKNGISSIHARRACGKPGVGVRGIQAVQSLGLARV